jgi:hypothetical protein
MNTPIHLETAPQEFRDDLYRTLIRDSLSPDVRGPLARQGLWETGFPAFQPPRFINFRHSAVEIIFCGENAPTGSASSTTGHYRLVRWDGELGPLRSSGNPFDWGTAPAGAYATSFPKYGAVVPCTSGGVLVPSHEGVIESALYLEGSHASPPTHLNFRDCALTQLFVTGMMFQTLDLSSLPALTGVGSFDLRVENLIFPGVPTFTSFPLYPWAGTTIDHLDISGCTGLVDHYFGNMGLRSIRAQGVGSLAFTPHYAHSYNALSVFDNQLSAAALNQLFRDLDPAPSIPIELYVGGNPGSATCDPTIATSKGYVVYGV